jgi:hypothetical protein
MCTGVGRSQPTVGADAAAAARNDDRQCEQSREDVSVPRPLALGQQPPRAGPHRTAHANNCATIAVARMRQILQPPQAPVVRRRLLSREKRGSPPRA